MKTRICLLVIIVSALAINAFAQIKITSKNVTYKRTGEDVADFKKTFDVNYPKFSGAKKEVLRQLDQTFSYWRVFSTSLEEETEYEWLFNLDYEVKYNKNGILVLTLTRSGAGAYPSDYQKTVVADVSSGMQVKFTNVFKNRIGLLSEIDKSQQVEMKAAEADFKKEGGDGSLFNEMVEKASDQVEEFFVDDYGVTFHFDYGFPHVSRALQPDGRYFFSWEQLKPFMKDYSVIASLAAKAPKVKDIVPILDLRIGGVLGGTANGKFVTALGASKAMTGGMSFVIFDPLSGSKGMTIDRYQSNWKAKLAKEQPDDICPDFRYSEITPKVKKGIAIGHNGKWNPVPFQITEISKTSRVYQDVVSKFLRSKGLMNSKVKIEQIYKVDLEGDSVDEVVIRATNYTHSENELTADQGGYSFVMVRKIVNGVAREILLTGDFVGKDHPGAENTHEISAIADLNGDGKMEIVVYGQYYEGAWVSVYGIENGEAKVVLETGCGL